LETAELKIVGNKYQQYLILFCVAAGAFLGGMDTSIINIAIPTMSLKLNASVGMVANTLLVFWVVNISFLLIFAKMGDSIGRKKIFIVGFIILALASFLCGVAQNVYLLIAARIIQGIGAAMIIGNGAAIVCEFLPQEQRGYYLGIVSTATNMGMAFGPSIGGFLITYSDWHSIFLINIPIALGVIIIGLSVLPKSSETKKTAFDITGSLLLCISLSLAVYALNRVNAMGLGNGYILFAFGLAAFFFGWFIKWELKVQDPLINLSLFKDLNFATANLSSFFLFISYCGAFFILPIYLCVLKGMSADRAGAIMMLITFTMGILSPVVGKLSDKFGSAVLCIPGAFLTILSYVLFLNLRADSSDQFIMLSILSFGFALALFFVANTRQVFSMVDKSQQGVAGGVLFTVRYLGAVIGVCLFEALFTHTISVGSAIHSESSLIFKVGPDVLLAAFKQVFMFGTIICLLTFLCALTILIHSKAAKDRAV
jgi:EmrB/QacA subfamily drug resistance transporter